MPFGDTNFIVGVKMPVQVYNFLSSTKFNFNFQILRKYTQIKPKLPPLISAISGGSYVNRPPANYHHSIWGGRFLSYNSKYQLPANDGMITHQKMKEEVRSMLTGCSNVSKSLETIDAIQRLGVHYHFQTEIDEILRKMVDKNKFSLGDENGDDLYVTSLKFQHLRQHGYNISCDVFDKFKDSNNKFKNSIISDARGMLSLYEATYLRTHGEETLDQALPFTIARLQSIATEMSSPLSNQIKYALKQPYHMSIPRLEARNYFQFYEGSDSCNKILLSFAKFDFNLLQKQHQKELSDINRWWTKSDFDNKLPISRDKIVRCYFEALGMYYEPEYFLLRKFLTKVFAIIPVIDDIYDVIGTLQELELFTTAIERWDLSEIEKLPVYMKEAFKALVHIYSEMEESMLSQGNAYRTYYVKEAIKRYVRASAVELKWFQQKHIPTMEEYMPVGLDSSGYHTLATAALAEMGDSVTKDTFDWLFTNPKIFEASTIIGRFMDDIADYEFDKNNANIVTTVDIYMKQYNCTEEEAMEELRKGIGRAWKDVNGEFIQQTSTTKPALIMFRKLNQMINFLYKNNDAGILKNIVSSFLVDAVPM